MSNEKETEEGKELLDIPRMTDDEIREFTDALLSSKVFTDAQIEDPEMIPSIFMPLMLGGASHLEPIIDDVGCLYEYTDKAGPMAINGYPMFFSFHIMHKEDWAVVLETYECEKTRRDTMPVIRKPKTEEPPEK